MRSASCQEGSSWRIKMFANEAHSQIVAALSGRSEATASLLNVLQHQVSPYSEQSTVVPYFLLPD